MKNKVLLLLIPLLGIFTLLYHGLSILEIPIQDIKVGVLLFIVGCSLMLSVLLLVSKEWLRIFILSVITFALFDIVFSSYTLVDHVVPYEHGALLRRGVRAIALLTLFSCLFWCLWLIRKHASTILAIVFGTLFAGTVLDDPTPLKFWDSQKISFIQGSNVVSASASGSTASQELPIVVHLLLDELLAPESIPFDIEGGKEVFDTIKDVHGKYRFRLYGRVYSRYYRSSNSILSLINFDFSSLTPAAKYKDPTRKRLGVKERNAYFEVMANRGYNIHVYQTPHLNFCNDENVVICETLNSFNPASKYISYSPSEKWKPTKYLFLSIVRAFKDSHIGRYVPLLVETPIWYDGQAFPLWFERLTERIIEAPRGTMIFAHILVPHAPYPLGRDCKVKEDLNYPYNLGKSPPSNERIDKSRAPHYKRYFKQTICVYRKLEGLLQKMEDAGRFEDAIVVIHGDHGTRISRSRYVEYMSKWDFVANYAALFSIRMPGIEPGYDPRFVPLQKLFTEYFAEPRRSGFSNGSHGETVVVDSIGPNGPIEVAMPIFGVEH